MRKLITLLCIVGSLLTCVAFAHPKREMGNLYPRAMIVDSFDTENDLVICIDATEHYWDFEEIEDWEVGDMVVAIVSDNGTPYMSDDYFVEIRYAGYSFP